MVWGTLQASFVALSRYSWQLLIFAVNRLKDKAILKALKQYEVTTGIRLELLCKPHGVGAKLTKRSEVGAALSFHMVYIRLEQCCDYGASVKM